mgnify:CR=1 FL=1
MQMTFRWYGEGNDSITPEMIKQIPGVTGLVIKQSGGAVFQRVEQVCSRPVKNRHEIVGNQLVWALHDKQAGEVWEVEEIEKARQQIEGAGFNMDVVEPGGMLQKAHPALPCVPAPSLGRSCRLSC